MPFSMDPPFTEEHDVFRRTVRDFVEKELQPHALEWDRAGIFPREVFKQGGRARLPRHQPRPEVRRQRAATTGTWPRSAEELARSRNAGVNMALLVQSQMATPIINEIGTDEQKREFLAPGARGREDRRARA